jgi:hypothetical protein
MQRTFKNLSRRQTAEQIHDINVANKSFENVAKFGKRHQQTKITVIKKLRCVIRTQKTLTKSYLIA